MPSTKRREKAEGDKYPSYREYLLAVAAHVYARDGLSVSLRKIMAEAEVNPAAIFYHFGGREQLLEALFEQGVQLLNSERERALEKALASEDCSLESIVGAYVLPAIEALADPERQDFMVILQRIGSEPGEFGHELLRKYADETHARFKAAISNCLPGMKDPELGIRYSMLIGATRHLMDNPVRITDHSGGKLDPHETTTLRKTIIPQFAKIFTG